MLRKTPLGRKTRLNPLSDRRRRELAAYHEGRSAFLQTHPICYVWLVENGWCQTGPDEFTHTKLGWRFTAEELVRKGHAPRASEIHHRAKRRGAMLNDETHWLAVCRANHDRIEANKGWAREMGFLLNF